MLESFSQSWLALQCQMTAGARAGVLLLGEPDCGPYRPVARWPQTPDGTAASAPSLLAAANVVLKRRRSLVNKNPSAPTPATTIAYPLIVNDRLYGAIALDIASPNTNPKPDAATLKLPLQQLRWGIAWLETLLRQQALTTNDQLVSVINLTANALAQTRFPLTVTWLVNELATALDCERVSLGWRKARGHGHGRGPIRLQALSHSARFNRKSNLVTAIEAAMTEALDQDITVRWPPDDDTILIGRAHGELTAASGGTACSVPLPVNGLLAGALTLERAAERPFTDNELELLETLAALLGPILDGQRRAERGPVARLYDGARALAAGLLGPGLLGRKLLALGAGALLLGAATLEDTYHVRARAALEGVQQRAVVAPLDGFIAADSPQLSAGDIVAAGTVLFKLDDRELQLEKLRLLSERQQLDGQYREALAQRQRADGRILKARLEQTEARLRLVEAELARMQGVAPIAGVIVSGDLSQQLGAPVERGQLLFEVAPLDQYRVVLTVDERDIRAVAPGQTGILRLAGAGAADLAFTVGKITPVTEIVDGRNSFRVEGRLQPPPESSANSDTDALALRPGMQGVGKIDAGRANLVWLWTYPLTDWLRLRLWSWWS